MHYDVDCFGMVVMWNSDGKGRFSIIFDPSLFSLRRWTATVDCLILLRALFAKLIK